MSAYMTMNRTTQLTNGVKKPRLHPNGLRHRAAAALKAFGQEFRRALHVMATRSDVSRLDDRMLQDLGISRAQAQFEASRAPWNIR